ncbi:MAG TPA: hypothetical protein DEA26_05885 [Oceanospirillales bacterium]|nr:hypothetical protein [Oceanospirillaceae bacterium]HBS42190.1 hypothetical protein [Oceanospirillales bacterium]|tara:strand:- start:4718 stop:5380 length:663 start_codon:yes stop_codon:yes gene_type:complete
MTLWWQRPQVQELLEKYRELSERERILVLITSHVLIAAVYLLLIATPLWTPAEANRNQANSMENNVLRMEEHLKRLRESPVLDPNAAVRDDLEKIKRQQSVINDRIHERTDTLVAPSEMTAVLEGLMAQEKGMKLVAMENTPGENIVINDNFSDVRLFRHGVRIEMKSDFSSIVSYLHRLDSMNWKLYWKMLDYQVTEYPQGLLTLEVYTLNTSEEILRD